MWLRRLLGALTAAVVLLAGMPTEVLASVAEACACCPAGACHCGHEPAPPARAAGPAFAPAAACSEDCAEAVAPAAPAMPALPRLRAVLEPGKVDRSSLARHSLARVGSKSPSVVRGPPPLLPSSR
jgi:hypothetical protein